MTLDDIADITEIADALNSVGADSLSEIADEVEAAARAHGVSIVAATIDLDGISLDSKLRVADVVELAAGSGAKLIYLSRTIIDTSPLVATIGDTKVLSIGGQDRKKILRALRRVDGFTSSIEVGFAHGGIVHTWERATTLADELGDLQDTIDGANYGPLGAETDYEGAATDKGAATDDEAFQRLAEKLAADPAFRRARSDLDHAESALLLPAVARLVDTQPWRKLHLIRLAYGVHNQERRALERELETRIRELAPLLAASSQFRSAHSADGRRKVTEEWIAENYSDGILMGRSLNSELYAAAKTHPVDQLGSI